MQPQPSSREKKSTDGELRVNNLWKAFLSDTNERIEVLQGLSFSVSAGEVIAITGASGAGKSTLLHVLAGFELADRGTIQIGADKTRFPRC